MNAKSRFAVLGWLLKPCYLSYSSLPAFSRCIPYSIDEIRRRVVPVAKKYQLATVFPFGSYARGEATVDSDVDLLIDLTNSTVHGFVLGGLYNDLEEALGVSVDLVTVASLEQPGGFPSDRLLRENIDREKIMIYAPTWFSFQNDSCYLAA